MPGIKGKSGRKSKSMNGHNAELILCEGAPQAARYVVDVAHGAIPNPNKIRVMTALEVIAHAIGRPKIKVDSRVTHDISLTARNILDLQAQIEAQERKMLEAHGDVVEGELVSVETPEHPLVSPPESGFCEQSEAK